LSIVRRTHGFGFGLSVQVLALLLAGTPDCRAAEKRPWKGNWWASVALVVAANCVDIHSSRGLGETNPLLRDGRGGFDLPRGVMIKSAATGGFLLMEFVLLRKMPRQKLEKPFAITNAMAAAAVAATAARNYGTPRTDPAGLPR
jgi:hypothetical protein